jgi:hypothetical protein
VAAPTWVKNGTRLTKSGGGASSLAPTISCTIGNYIVALFEFNVFSSTSAIATPSGWTLLHSRAPSGAQTYRPQVAAFGKVAASTTETCTITTVGSDTYGYGQLSRVVRCRIRRYVGQHQHRQRRRHGDVSDGHRSRYVSRR